jgi:hypothetical protein
MTFAIRVPARPSLFGLVAGLLLVLASPGHSQETGRTLGGHTFMPSGQVRSEPFITQHFRERTTGGIASGFVSPVVVNDTLTLLEGDIGFLGIDAEYQHAFGEWLALRLRLGGSARVGTSGEALLAQGVSTVYTSGLDATVKLFRWDNAMLSAGLSFGSSQIYGTDILGYLQKAIEDREFPPSDSLVASTESSSAKVSALGAWAPLPWLGLAADVGVGYADLFGGENRSDPLFSGGAVAGLDLGPLAGFPVGFTLAGDYDSVAQQGADVATKAWGLGFGVHYTGRENLDLSLEYGLRHLPLVTYDKDLVLNAASFNIRYYWR